MPARKHVLVLCYPTFGHYIPMLEFAERVVPFHDVTLVVSATRDQEILQRHLSPPDPIRLHFLDDQLSINLDENFTEMKQLIQIIKEQAPHYARFVASLNQASSALPHVDAVFCDIFQHAPCQPCHDKGIPLYIVSTYPAELICGMMRIEKDTPTIPDETFFSSQDVGEEKEMGSFAQKSGKVVELNQKEAVKCAKGILFNSFEKIEPTAMQELQKIPELQDKSLMFVGPLIRTQRNLHHEIESGFPAKVMQWMNRQKEQSVVYCSFGSIAVASKEQLIEIGNALLETQRPFIWALRPFQQEHLPDTFQRTNYDDNVSLSAKYLIVPWASQKSLLAHRAIALFISHCGWNSTLEAVHCGVPLIAWPMFGDQHFNAKLVEQVGIGVAIPATGMMNARLVPAQEISETVERVIGKTADAGDRSGFRKKVSTLAAQAQHALSEEGTSTRNLAELLKNL
ncbi:uncharacterized protein LOC129597834 [Paramacrobiotus metropolitanus]|uniref:uncharacterized protein LOC129597834 n=1 Tax=Paramacrobiotus metropolitanus TaxID=2943436 RepID=UPI002445DE00|nr:uncharacterized protein LOC129597834 [Paramacrobiotus metropolitanus]